MKRIITIILAISLLLAAASYSFAESPCAGCNHVTDDVYHYMGESHSNSDYTQHYWWESIYCYKCGYIFSTRYHSTHCTAQQCYYIA